MFWATMNSLSELLPFFSLLKVIMTSSCLRIPYVELLIHILWPYHPVNLPIILINIQYLAKYIVCIQSITSNWLLTFDNDVGCVSSIDYTSQVHKKTQNKLILSEFIDVTPGYIKPKIASIFKYKVTGWCSHVCMIIV